MLLPFLQSLQNCVSAELFPLFSSENIYVFSYVQPYLFNAIFLIVINIEITNTSRVINKLVP